MLAHSVHGKHGGVQRFNFGLTLSLEITIMLNITPKLVLFTMCGALLAAGSNASNASNIYSTTPEATEEAATAKPQPGYWSCPAEIMGATVRADNLVPRTDVPVSDTPEQPARSLEDESRYYDYSRMIFAAVIGYFAFSEIPDQWTWIGSGIIAAATLYIARREAKLNRQAALAAGAQLPITAGGS